MISLSRVSAVFFAMLALVLCFSRLIGLLEEMSNSNAMLAVIVGYSACTVFLGFASYITTIAIAVVVCRGFNFMAFSKPSDCRSIGSWTYSYWNYWSNGKQVGYRVFGFEMAVEGRLI